MPSDQKKKRDLKKKEAAKKKQGQPKSTKKTEDSDIVEATPTPTNGNGIAKPTKVIEDDGTVVTAGEFRSVAGSLASHPEARDLHIINFSILFHGQELLVDTTLELNCGRRYGLLGLNGSGKSSLLSVIGNREINIPAHINIYHLTREMAPSDKSALETVMEVDELRIELERECDDLALSTSDEAHERLMDITEQLEEMDAATAQMRAGQILDGLGFSPQMQAKKVKDYSGGWRMRIALARALFIKPAMLLLDEPTNHLDLNACVWLERYLRTYNRILVIISHSQDFMNGVCTNIINIQSKKLKYYTGNYDAFVKTRSEQEENQMKKFKWEQDQISNMKNYIARFGHGSAKLARQAQSKEKTLKKMVDSGLTERVSADKVLSFYFPDCGKIPPPVIQVQNVSFRYNDDTPYIYKNLEFGFDLDTRLALVGPNGAGKSTLLKLIVGELNPTAGLIRRHSHLKIGRYHQHLAEILDYSMSALDWMLQSFPAIKDREEMRKIVGRYGLTGLQQTCPIRNLSDGQRCRVIFAWLAWQRPHLLLLDEPTNHLDMETIDALAEAINYFDGGMLLVSHDFRLISQVAENIWICENETVTPWEGDILNYKTHLIKQIEKEERRKALVKLCPLNLDGCQEDLVDERALQLGLQPIGDQITLGYRDTDGIFDNKCDDNSLEQLWTRWIHSKGYKWTPSEIHDLFIPYSDFGVFVIAIKKKQIHGRQLTRLMNKQDSLLEVISEVQDKYLLQLFRQELISTVFFGKSKFSIYQLYRYELYYAMSTFYGILLTSTFSKMVYDNY